MTPEQQIEEMINDPMFRRIFLESVPQVPWWYTAIYRVRLFLGV
jgi:hypothetical protein